MQHQVWPPLELAMKENPKPLKKLYEIKILIKIKQQVKRVNKLLKKIMKNQLVIMLMNQKQRVLNNWDK